MANVYKQRGFDSRQDYLIAVASTYELPLYSVEALANMLGKEEDFDGLLSMCADEAGTTVTEVMG